MIKLIRLLAILSILLSISTQSFNSLRITDEEKKHTVKNEMKNYLTSIINNLNDPRFKGHKKLPMLISLYEKLDMDKDKKKKNQNNKWRYG